MYADLVMIVAAMCGTKIEEVVVEKGSDLEKNLLKRTVQGTYPMLEIDANTIIFDSVAIASYIARSTGNDSLIGADDFEQSQYDQWMQFLREETTPIVKTLQWYSFGHVPCTLAEYNLVYNEFKENIKTLNNHLKTKKFMVGSTLTICDIYLCLTQVEMQQCLMDTNMKNSLQFINTIFKHVTTEVDPWVKRMGAVKPGKK